MQAICDRVGILRQGRLSTVEQVSKLTQVGFRWVRLQLRETGALPGRLEALAGVSEVQVEGNSLRLRLSGDFDPLLRALQECYVEELQVHEPSLEEISSPTTAMAMWSGQRAAGHGARYCCARR